MIGCGAIARTHANVLRKLEEVQLVACYDYKLENARRFAAEYGINRVYDDVARLFAEGELQLAYICLPPFAHADEVALACEHGVHFLIEKPIALTIEQASEMAAHVQASGVKTQVGFKFRHGAAVQLLKAYLEENEAAGRAFLTMHYDCNSLHSHWWRERRKSGGQLVEQVIHLLDVARFLLGEPAQVFSMQDNRFHHALPSYTIEDVSATTIRFKSGALANVTATNGAIPDRWEYSWRLVLPQLTADVSDANHTLLHHTDRSPVLTTSVAEDKDLFLAQTEDLLGAIRENRESVAPIEEGVRSLRLALAAARSAALNVPVDLD